jgi:hypothetical protein
MKTLIKHLIILYAISAISTPAMSQVTIGSTEDPTTGALLQIKQRTSAPANEYNAKGGLLLPRVELTPTDTDPMSPIINGNSGDQKKEHTGLVVYNRPGPGPTQLEQQEGLTFWDGEQWNYIKAKASDNIEAGVKKILYQRNMPNSSNTIKLDYLEILLDQGTTSNYYAIPKITNTSTTARSYHWHYARFWDTNDPYGKSYGYSNDIVVTDTATSFTALSENPKLTYNTPTALMDTEMPPKERNEAWITDKLTGEIYHLHFFTMGVDNTNATKIYGIIGEQF